MTSVAAPVAPARPVGTAGTALRRLVLGPELSLDERAVLRSALEHLPARLRRVDGHGRWRGTRTRRVMRRAGVVMAVFVVFAVLSMATAPSAQAFDIFGPVKHAFEDAMNWFIDQIAHAICDFVANLVHGILGYADKGLGINFNVAWFMHNYQNMMMGGFLMGLAIMLVQCIAAALRRNPTQMLTAVSATLIGVLASFVSLSLIMMVSGAVDDWCAAVTGGHSIADGTRDTIKGLVDKIGGIGAILVAVLYLVFSILLFIVLIVRRLGIFVISLFIPVYAGGLGGGWTNGMIKRAAELLFVLLIGDTKGLDVEVSAVGGVVVMAFAVLSPLGVMYLVAFADGLLVGQLNTASNSGRGGLSNARNQLRGHDGRGNRSALGRVTGAGSKQVRPAHAGGSSVIASARRAAQRVRPGGTSGSRPGGGRGPTDPAASTARQSRARGARRAASGGAASGRPTDGGQRSSSPRSTPRKNRGSGESGGNAGGQPRRRGGGAG
jgi:hypothetical protein